MRLRHGKSRQAVSGAAFLGQQAHLVVPQAQAEKQARLARTLFEVATVVELPQKTQAKSGGYWAEKSVKTARANRKAGEQLKLAGRGVRAPSGEIGEIIRCAEIGELGAVRSLRDRPPDWLHYQLQNSIGDFAPENKPDSAKVLRWKVVTEAAGKKLSALQDHDLIVDDEDMRERFPKQPIGKDIRGARSGAGADYEAGFRQAHETAPAPPTINQQTDLAGLLKEISADLSIPAFLQRGA
jgi:hypothetical protein